MKNEKSLMSSRKETKKFEKKRQIRFQKQNVFLNMNKIK